jgi:hypothetical protein
LLDLAKALLRAESETTSKILMKISFYLVDLSHPQAVSPAMTFFQAVLGFEMTLFPTAMWITPDR